VGVKALFANYRPSANPSGVPSYIPETARRTTYGSVTRDAALWARAPATLMTPYLV
jgi:hypothetical protein